MPPTLNSYDPSQLPQSNNAVASPFLPVGQVAPEAAAAIQGATSQGAKAGEAAGAEVDPVTGQPKVDATSQPGYDPNNPTPYQDQGAQPGVTPVASTASGLPPEEPIQHLGAVTPAGAAAYTADKLFRGYLQGRAVADIRKAVQLQKTSQGLNALYHTAAENLYNLAQKGVDPNSDEFMAARNQANAAWQAQVDFLGQHVQAQKTDKKTGKQVPDQGNLLQRIFKPNDPAEVAPALYEAMQKTGPPVLHQIAPFLTPDYQAKVQQRAATQGAATGTAQTSALTGQQQAQMTSELVALRAKPNPTDDDTQRIGQLQNALRPIASPTMKPYKMANGQIQYFDVTRPDMIPEGATAVLTAAQQGLPASVNVPVRMWSKDPTGKVFSALYDKRTNQEMPNTRNFNQQPPPNIVGHIATGSATDANGVTTSHSSSIAPSYVATSGPAPVGPNATIAAQSSNAAAIAQSGHTPGQTVSPDVPLAAHPGAGTPAATRSLPPGVPKVAAPVTSTPSVAPSAPNGWPSAPNPNTVSWAYRLNTGQAKPGDVPGSLKSSVANYMTTNNIETVPPENAMQNNAEAAMKDVTPAITKAMAMLEPYKDQNGITDAIGQRMKFKEYQFGANPGPLQTAINQWTAFTKIAAASPWSKVGRGKYIFEQIQEHLPDPSKDAPGLMYQKLSDLQQIFKDQQDAIATRLNRAPGQGPGQAVKPTTQPVAPVQGQPAQQQPVQAPTHQVSLAAAANLPQYKSIADVNQRNAKITADAKARNYLVVP